MNWITTNLRIPEDVYMEIKMKAARERKSVAALIREKLTEKADVRGKNAKRLLRQIEDFGKKIAKKHPGLNLTRAVIDARYEE